jgi:hypothetical protein
MVYFRPNVIAQSDISWNRLHQPKVKQGRRREREALCFCGYLDRSFWNSKIFPDVL